MAKDEGTVHQLRAVRSDAPDETAESILPGLPRVGALDALLREVDGLRLSLETDLNLAASAVEAGSVGIARDIIDSDIDGLRRFERRALGQLAELSAADLSFDRALHDDDIDVAWWRRVPKTPFVAAASVVAVLLLAVPSTTNKTTDVNAANVSASERLEQITSLLASAGQTSQIRDAAVSLHGQLLRLVEQAKTDPVAAQAGLKLLSAERTIIALSGDSAALRDVLADSTNLSNLIISHLPAAIRPTVAPVKPAVVTPTTAPTKQPTAKPTSTPSSKPTATPSAKPSSSPTTSPSPSPSSGTPVLPSPGTHNPLD